MEQEGRNWEDVRYAVTETSSWTWCEGQVATRQAQLPATRA